MKRLVVTVVAAGAALAAVAMPTKAELQKAQEMVNDVTAADVAALKAKSKTPAEVAAKHMELAGQAGSEAEKYLLLQGAFKLYAKAGDYDAAANVIEKLQAEISDYDPEVTVELCGAEFIRKMRENAPRLYALKENARRIIFYRKQRPIREAAVKKNPRDPQAQRRLAECHAELGDWPKALEVFAKAGGEFKKMSEGETSGKLPAQELGDFWWDYETKSDTLVYKLHAAELYRKAIADDSFKGLARTRAEQRVKEVAGNTVIVAAAGVTSIGSKQVVIKQLEHAGYLAQEDRLLWEGVSVDDIQGFTATMAGGHISHPGKVVGYVVDSGDGWRSVQFQIVDGVDGQGFLKSVCSRFEQKGNDVHGYVEKAVVAEDSVVIGTDLRTVKSAKEYYLCFKDDGDGYGIKDVVVTIGGKSASALSARTPSSGSIELKTGGDSPFVVKGNEATLTLKSGVKLEFVKCPAGKYKMGFTESKSCLKYHSVTISRPFWMAKLPMTYKLLDGILGKMKRNDGEKSRPAFKLDVLGGDNAPAAITYNQALDVLKRLNQECQTHLPGGYILRMPSEAEYEYAAKSGRSEYNVKTDGADEITLFQDRLRALHARGLEAVKWDHCPWRVPYFAVGGKKANNWGLYDMFTAGWAYTLDSVNCKRETDTEALTPYYVDGSVDPVQIESGDGNLLLGVVAGCGWGCFDAKYQGRSWVKFLIERGDARHDDCFLRVVIGPDLVSEWKAKNGKK